MIGATAADVASYLARVLESTSAIPDNHPPPADPVQRKGRFRARSVEAGSSAEAAGVRVGDLLLRVDGREIVSVPGLAAIPDDGASELRYEFRRDGDLVEMRHRGRLGGIGWDFETDR